MSKRWVTFLERQGFPGVTQTIPRFDLASAVTFAMPFPVSDFATSLKNFLNGN